MKCHAVTVGKYALLVCNFIFLLSGISLVALGCLLAHDTPRLLLSMLAVQPAVHMQPLLYYVSLGFIVTGMLIVMISAVGCWAGCVTHATCLMAIYLFLLIVLLVSEVSFGAVAILCPQLLGVDMDRDILVENLQRNYGLPARDHYTAAIDLAQTLFECCGMSSGADYDNAFWRDREVETRRDWRVPLSCCIIENNQEVNAFLDPHPLNDTLCQAKNNALYQQGRHTKGCIDQLNAWFHDHSTIFLVTGMSLIVVQLCVLISSIFLCMKRAKDSTHPRQHDYSENTLQPRVVLTPTDATTMRNDEVYPVKRKKLTIALDEHGTLPDTAGPSRVPSRPETLPWNTVGLPPPKPANAVRRAVKEIESRLQEERRPDLEEEKKKTEDEVPNMNQVARTRLLWQAREKGVEEPLPPLVEYRTDYYPDNEPRGENVIILKIEEAPIVQKKDVTVQTTNLEKIETYKVESYFDYEKSWQDFRDFIWSAKAARKTINSERVSTIESHIPRARKGKICAKCYKNIAVDKQHCHELNENEKNQKFLSIDPKRSRTNFFGNSSSYALRCNLFAISQNRQMYLNRKRFYMTPDPPRTVTQTKNEFETFQAQKKVFYRQKLNRPHDNFLFNNMW